MSERNWEEFEKLNSEEQAKLFHQAPFKERYDLLLHASNPHFLTSSLSREELYLMTREMDLDERVEILRYANLPQLFFVSDMSCWHGDRLNTKGFLSWIETLANADETKLLDWLLEMDYDAVVAGLKGVIRVIKPEREYAIDEVLGDMPYFTLDEMYYIVVTEENLETVRSAIQILYENHRGRYVALLEGVMGEMDDEVEEEAFRKRSMRLAERGFPEPEVANLIYRPISRQEFDAFPRKERRTAERSLEMYPHYPVPALKEPLFLDEIILYLRAEPAEVLDSIQEELAWLSNKVIAAQGIDFTSEEAVRKGIDRARSFVSIGLELLTGRDVEQGQRILRECWLEPVFRFGYTPLHELRDEALGIVRKFWKSDRAAFLQFLSVPYDKTLDGILQKVPQFYAPEAANHPDESRDFRTAHEIDRARKGVLQIRSVHEDLRKKAPQIFRDRDREEDGLTLFTVMGTMFCNYVTLGQFISRAVKPADLKNFLKKAFETKGEKAVIREDVRNEFLKACYSERERNELQIPWALVFDHLEDELGHLNPHTAIEPDFISGLWLQTRKRPSPKGAAKIAPSHRKNR